MRIWIHWFLCVGRRYAVVSAGKDELDSMAQQVKRGKSW